MALKINQEKLQTSSFYRLYVHYLYLLGKLPPKIHYEERTKEYYQEIHKFNKLCDELNIISDYDLKSIEDTQNLRAKYLDEVAPLKAEREKLRKMYNKSNSVTDKNILEVKINVLTKDINEINTKIQTCKRVINKVEKGEKEDWLIQKRLEDNKLKNEKENTKNKDNRIR